MRNVWPILRGLLAACLIAALVYFAGVSEVLTTLKEVTPGAFLVLLLISFPLILISAWKWKLFLHELSPDGAAPSTWRLFGLYLVGYFVNLLLPSFVGGDVVRSYYAGKSVGQHGAAAATILERYTGLLAMVALALVVMPASTLVTLEIEMAVLGVAAAILGLTLMALSRRAVTIVHSLPGGAKISRHLSRIQEALHLARKNRLLLLKTFGLSLLFHCFTVLNTLAAAWAVGWEGVPSGDLFVVLPLILLIGALPLAPSGLGIQEGAFFYFLQGVGATPAQAIAVALVLRMKSYVLALMGGIVFWRERRDPRAHPKVEVLG
jgi:uncharacterized protein (TIRG00374 family)